MGRSQADPRAFTGVWERVVRVSTSTPHEATPAVAAQPLRPPASLAPVRLEHRRLDPQRHARRSRCRARRLRLHALGSSSSASAATRTATVQRGVVTTSVSASGSVASAGDVAANFQTGGTLTALLVKQGQHVTKGQVLARIDSLSARQSVQEAEASLATAQGPPAADAQPAQRAGEGAARRLERRRPPQSVQTRDRLALGHQGAERAEPRAGADRRDAAPRRSSRATRRSSRRTRSRPPPSAQSAVSQDAGQDQLGPDGGADGRRERRRDEAEEHPVAAQRREPGRRRRRCSSRTTPRATPSRRRRRSRATWPRPRPRCCRRRSRSRRRARRSRETTLRAPISGVGRDRRRLGRRHGLGRRRQRVVLRRARARRPPRRARPARRSSSSSSSLVTITGQNKLQVVAGLQRGRCGLDQASAQPATATISALPGVTLRAKVIAIDSTATTVSNVVTYNVTFALTGTNAKLKPGMTADVEVITAERDNALHVPTTAVTGSGANARVTVLRNGQQVVDPGRRGPQGRRRDRDHERPAGRRHGRPADADPHRARARAPRPSATGGGRAALRAAAGGFGGGGFGGP